MKQTSKIAVLPSAEEALDRMVKAANQDFLGGRITKHQLASWLITRFEGDLFKRNIESLRHDNFDQVAYLEAVTKKIKKAGKEGIETNLEDLLTPLVSKPKRLSKRIKEKEIPSLSND